MPPHNRAGPCPIAYPAPIIEPTAIRLPGMGVTANTTQPAADCGDNGLTIGGGVVASASASVVGCMDALPAHHTSLVQPARWRFLWTRTTSPRCPPSADHHASGQLLRPVCDVWFNGVAGAELRIPAVLTAPLHPSFSSSTPSLPSTPNGSNAGWQCLNTPKLPFPDILGCI
jgi:hypothetical protein